MSKIPDPTTIEKGGERMYMGIDMHKETCYATTLDKEGEIIERREFKNEREAWERFVGEMPRDSKVAIEACSYWYPVCDFLEEWGIEMILTHPSKTRIIAEAKIKTDKIDSEILAKLLRADFLPRSYMPSKEMRENRELLRLRVQLGKDRTVIKNRTHALMAKNGVKHEFSDLFGVEGKNYLRAIELPESQRIALDVLLRQLESVDNEIEYVQKRIAVIANEDRDILLLMTVPGIDYYSAMIIKNEIGELERFPGYKELCSFAGLVPRVHQSANTRWAGHITKEGDALLRWILIQVVHRVVRYPGELRKFYLRLKKEKGTKIAVVATARKLLRVIYCMLSRKESYRYERKALTESKLKRLEKTVSYVKNEMEKTRSREKSEKAGKPLYSGCPQE
jgi:transposase